MKIRLLFVLTCVLALMSVCAGRPAFAGGSQEILQLQTGLKEQIQGIVAAYDPKAMVFVKIVPKVAKKLLPGTPFEVTNFSLTDAAGNIEIQATEVEILSQKAPFSDKVLELVRGIVNRQGYQATFVVKELPAEFAQSGAGIDGEKEKAEERALREAAQKHEEDRDKEREKIAQQQWEDTKQQWVNTSQVLRTMALALFGVGAALLVLGGFMAFARRNGSKSLATVLTGGFQKLSEAMEGGAGRSASGDRSQNSRDSQDSRDAMPGTRGGSGAAQDVISDYPEESLFACLADCYWTKSDDYAAYLWKRISASKKREMLSATPWVSEYVSTLTGVREQDLGAIEEPYYLSPWPITHLANDALAALVRANPTLFSRLPSIRAAALPLGAVERVAIRQRDVKAFSPISVKDFESHPPSAARTLKKRTPIPIRDLEEEREILALPGLTSDLMAEVASLGWLKLLPAEEAEKILSPFTARELASCWIGPEEVLQGIEQHLSPKKREMVRSYVRSVPASRDSEAFQSIHASAIDWLEKHAPALPESVDLSDSDGSDDSESPESPESPEKIDERAA